MTTLTRYLIALALPLLAHAAGVEGDWNRVERLQPGQNIEVVDDKMRSYRGEFGAAGADEMSLQTANGPLILKREAVIRVTLRENSKRLRNALIGAAIGGGAGIALGAIVDKRFSNEGRAGMGYAICAPLGAGLGAGLGAASHGFETIYRAKPSGGGKK